MPCMYSPPPMTAEQIAAAEARHVAHPPVRDADERFTSGNPSGISGVWRGGKLRTVAKLLKDAKKKEGKR